MGREDTVARVAQIHQTLERDSGGPIYVLQLQGDMRWLLTALVTAEAERDHARRELALQQGSFAAVMAERDAARADLKRIADRLCREDEEYAAKVAAAEQRTTRLAAALQWAVTTLDGYRADVPGTEHWMGGWADWLEQQARPALTAPPREGA